MIDKYLLEDLSLRNDEKGELARWVIQLQAGVGTEQRKSASLESVIYARDTRIAELESIATDYAGKFQKAQDAAKHLIIMNDSAQAEIAHLKALLATPVRLPKRWDVSGQVNPPRIVQVQFEQQNRTHDQCAEAIRSAGFTFTVKGGEQ
ncbi:hypothetical protein [Serratia sp. 1D1416]|uniref:hypothetical protein n=1 Tax=Serratia sp. 1D1416 TaxID=2447890 RepID=UPI001013C6CE|nr:hypothetical protein [Serratia sp. 1D1416]